MDLYARAVGNFDVQQAHAATRELIDHADPPDAIFAASDQTALAVLDTLRAEGLRRFVDIVGMERVMAGSDCGFGTFAGFGAVDPDIAYAKLAALAEGAALAAGRR